MHRTFLIILFNIIADFSQDAKQSKCTKGRQVSNAKMFQSKSKALSTHCLGMSYYVNFLGDLGSNEFHIKRRFGTPQCARTDLNKRFLPKPMTTTG